MGRRCAALVASGWAWIASACVAGSDDYRCPASAPNLIETCLHAPVFVAYRDGGGPWQTPPTSGETNKLCVADDYMIIVVDEGSGGTFRTSEYASTYGETTPAIAACALETSPSPPAMVVTVTGEMAQLGTIGMGDDFNGTGTNGTAPWPFSLAVATGDRDLVADNDIDGSPGNMLIRRHQDIEAATVEPLVDVVADGTPMTPTPLAIAGLVDGDSLSAYVSLTTSNTYAFQVSQTTATTVDVVPASLLEPTDEQDLEIDVGSGDRYHSASATFTGSETSFGLMPYVAGVSFPDGTGLTAFWSSLPVATYTSASIWLEAPLTGGFTSVVATKGWLDHHGSSSLSFDSSVPGYDPSWTIDPSTQGLIRNFSVYDDSTSISYVTGIQDVLNR